MSDGVGGVELVENRIGILRTIMMDEICGRFGIDTNLAQTGSIHDDFEQVAHCPEKIVHTWSLEDVKVMPVGLDFDGNDKVGLLNGL